MKPIHGALFLGATLSLVFASPPAEASLSSSEKGVIRELVSTARLDNAQKVRSLVARTDLTPDESAAALGEAVVPVPFSDARGAFLNELLFGGTSAPSRPLLTVAAVKAVLARADSIYQRYVGGLDHEGRAISELVAMYGWLDSAIANAGKPTTAEHDPTAGIPVATYDACAKALQEHIDHNARWLKGDGSIPATTVRVRAQAQVALADMLPDGVTRRVQASDRLALKGARKSLLTDYGILLEDSGKIDEAGAERVRQLLIHLPGVRPDLSLIVVEDGSARLVSGFPLQARGQVVHVAPGPEAYPFDEAAPPSYDATTSGVAHDLGVVLAQRVLDSRWAQLRLQAERDLVGVAGDRSRLLGRPRGPSVEYVVGAAIHALLVDAPKTLDLAAQRTAAGHSESIALVSDALGVLAAPRAQDQDPKASPAARLELGKAGAAAPVTNLRFAPNGTVVGFKLDGHTWAIDRASPSYVIMGVRKDGQVVATSPAASAPKAPAPPTKR